jgi:hypothetical protein
MSARSSTIHRLNMPESGPSPGAPLARARGRQRRSRGEGDPELRQDLAQGPSRPGGDRRGGCGRGIIYASGGVAHLCAPVRERARRGRGQPGDRGGCHRPPSRRRRPRRAPPSKSAERSAPPEGPALGARAPGFRQGGPGRSGDRRADRIDRPPCSPRHARKWKDSRGALRR